MGGRIASQAAARDLFDPSPAGLVFFGYPLHPPGEPAQRRDRHLPAIRVPMLFLHGTRDPFGSPDEMQALAAGLATAQLELIEGGDHSLAAGKRADPKGQSIDRALDLAAEFMSPRIFHEVTKRGRRARRTNSKILKQDETQRKTRREKGQKT